MRRIAPIALSLFLAACQGVSTPGNSQLGYPGPNCSADIRAFRSNATQDGVVNAGFPTLPYFPLLHSNRFLHSLSRSVQSNAEIREWTTLLAELGIATRAFENRNLDSPWSPASLDALAACSRDFAVDASFQQDRAALLAAVQGANFPMAYSQPRQAIGALPLLRPFLRQRILALHAEERAWFAAEDSFSRSTRYRFATAAKTHSIRSFPAWMRAAYDGNGLTLPLPSEAQLDAMFAEHAPNLQIEYEADNDRIGSPRWEGDRVAVDTLSPLVYTMPSMVQFEGRNLLQLNYVFWFPERRSKAPIDLYSGNVDSIIWRVTLDEDGLVLLYDSIHSCGCYHKYFIASDSLVARSQPDSKEPANIFSLDADTIQNGPTLAITANEHYIVGLGSAAHSSGHETLSYDLLPYETLYSLPSDDGRRSLFDARGLIPGSERLERFTLWPTGIPSVGAMRQWGTHATGFIEEQHFDDADLLGKYFEAVHE